MPPSDTPGRRNPGAEYLGEGRCRFLVWAPLARSVDLHLISPKDRTLPLLELDGGWFTAVAEDVRPGARYLYRINGHKERPDPATRLQPRGVHGPSEVADPSFEWRDTGWRGVRLQDYILYELHVGTFTPEGTLDAAAGRLQELADLGITAVELMPVAEFPGSRNWGYDGVYPFAVQSSYGGPTALKRFVQEAHRLGLAVVLDAVYNHAGPEGNYLADFGPYFTGFYKTPWGAAFNFDGPDSDAVREFFISNALYWARDFHIDALRLDAAPMLRDFSEQTFLEELSAAVKEEADRLGRRIYLIAEDAMNNERLVKSPELGGCGLDGAWLFDFHHSLHVALTGERGGYYADFNGLRDLATAFTQGYVLSGRYSRYRGRRVGRPATEVRAHQLMVYAQNHDEVGNRLSGERLGSLVSLEAQKLAAGAVMLSPFIPMLFMGEEYGEKAPFQFFTSFSDPAIAAAARLGRREYLAVFMWAGGPPDPQEEACFKRSKLDRYLSLQEPHKSILAFYRELIRLRRSTPALAQLSKERVEVQVFERSGALCVRRWAEGSEISGVLHFGKKPVWISLPVPAGRWTKLLDSADARWAGPGSQAPAELVSEGETFVNLSPLSFCLFLREQERRGRAGMEEAGAATLGSPKADPIQAVEPSHSPLPRAAPEARRAPAGA